MNLTLRPQPLGILPFPAGLLVLPQSSDPEAPTALAQLFRGAVDGALPETWEFYRLAANGDLEGALERLANSPNAEEERDVHAYNQFVLAPDAATFHALSATFNGELALLLSVAAYVSGLSDESPNPLAADAQTSSDVLGLAWLVRAAGEIERGDLEAALSAVDLGLTALGDASPLLAAQLQGQRASLLRERDLGAARAAYRAALDLVRREASGPLVNELAVHLAVSLGTLEQEVAASSDEGGRMALLAAIEAYHEAIRAGLSAESDPDTYALVQNNLGLAYLALPMREAKDTLRRAVAVQAFREALRIYTRESHPEAWASTQANLANALQYLPSAHPVENLAQAVEIYEELLTVRPSALDPLGHARLLANQANALAHLGAFAPARAKLSEAHKLFHWHGAPELAAAVLEQVANIDERLAATEATAAPTSV